MKKENYNDIIYVITELNIREGVENLWRLIEMYQLLRILKEMILY